MIADLLIDIAAAHRITRLIVDDTIADRPRAWLHARLPAKAVEGLGCYWCVGWWVAVAISLIRGTRAWRHARIPLAISTGIGVIADTQATV